MPEITPEIETFARIKVIGVGGGGNAAVERMIKSKVHGIEFVVVNTDAQALHHSHANRKVHIGKATTRGLGSGADPETGKRAVEESAEDVAQALKGADMIFITLGEGGGTGTGAAPLIAAMAREAGALVVAIVTKPFAFEGEKRRHNAEQGIEELKDNVDTLIIIPNDRLLQMIDRKTTLLDAFSMVDEVLHQGVQGISDLITVNGLINLDFADVKTIMQNAGSALMGIGRASGENRAMEAARQAVDSPLLETSVEGAKGVLFNITGGRNMTMHEIDEAAKAITDAVDHEANIIFGAVLDETMDDEVKITVVATGFQPKKEVKKMTLPSFTRVEDRAPFIDERPTVLADPEEANFNSAVTSEPSYASIEPDQPNETELINHQPPIDEPPANSSEEETEELDIPAFIRRKIN